MIYRRRRQRNSVSGGFYRFEGGHGQSVFGFGDHDYIRLRDEFGNVWRGHAEKQGDSTLRFSFRDSNGSFITGISDHTGILLRDEHGNTWRGFKD
ncbi:MAG: hypothetical protein HY822_17845 [Acidobacteria bacterium]|nr:hypothetical protein [Acidobacteriota bacterium]